MTEGGPNFKVRTNYSPKKHTQTIQLLQYFPLKWPQWYKEANEKQLTRTPGPAPSEDAVWKRGMEIESSGRGIFKIAFVSFYGKIPAPRTG